MRLLIVVLLLVAGCTADTPPSPPYAVPATRPPTDEPIAGRTQEPTPEPDVRAEPTAVAHGFTADAELDSASYAVIIENPNARWIPRFIEVSITFLDAAGAVIATQTQNIPGMLPESETAVAGDASEAGEAAEMEVRISELNALPNPIRSSLETGRYEFARMRTARAQSGGITTTGAVLSRFESEQLNVPVHVVYFGPAGEVVGGAATYVDHLPPGEEVAFEASTSVTVPDIAETRVYGPIGFGN